ncbi:GntR family transcriptional regulator [Sanguibacter sp. Leaf3]|uniref:GntR family transcriptional regulator n=1 Tax=Sanguibacter sp. Leaf3 TaxID=1736209 RepID=UPI0006FCE7C9|nr:GntR family transcriptional regulator [Sanguibacter sp. Leaf3]KQT96622.1 GntR family transcriptional regulator [Sanguibacter sp. Leaf3]
MFDGRDPIYLQIADQIRRDVLAGSLPEGTQVMSTTQYATTFRINPATAAKAFALLVDDGVLYKQRGVGMFVADGAAERLRAASRADFFADELAPVLERAALLGITTDEIQRYIASTAATTAPQTVQNLSQEAPS